MSSRLRPNRSFLALAMLMFSDVTDGAINTLILPCGKSEIWWTPLTFEFERLIIIWLANPIVRLKRASMEGRYRMQMIRSIPWYSAVSVLVSLVTESPWIGQLCGGSLQKRFHGHTTSFIATSVSSKCRRLWLSVSSYNYTFFIKTRKTHCRMTDQWLEVCLYMQWIKVAKWIWLPSPSESTVVVVCGTGTAVCSCGLKVTPLHFRVIVLKHHQFLSLKKRKKSAGIYNLHQGFLVLLPGVHSWIDLQLQRCPGKIAVPAGDGQWCAGQRHTTGDTY